LTPGEAERRLEIYGPNSLPQPEPPGVAIIFFRQFINPLIYILLAAAVVSLFLREWADAVFIFVVLLINAVIGAVQEYHAQRSAESLKQLVVSQARVERGGEAYEIAAVDLVPGDIALIESGNRVPAGLRLLVSSGLEIDESLLTGESMPVAKQAERVLGIGVPLADRVNMAFAGTLVTRGRGRGVVVATGRETELGHIAQAIGAEGVKAPLIQRMERFTFRIGVAVLLMAGVIGAVAAWQGMVLAHIFFLVVALVVSAIPEGLPVAMTVALAIGVNRMARRNVIVRKLVAVESLGSCTFIGADKTGTLTMNELTARRVLLPGEDPWEVSGEGMIPEGAIRIPADRLPEVSGLLTGLCRAVTLANEGFLGRRDGGWAHHGDPVDVALLVLAHKAGITQVEAVEDCPQLGNIPFESERMYAASLNQVGTTQIMSVKGAWERVLPLCDTMATAAGDVPLDQTRIEQQVLDMARAGYRVLAVAAGRLALESGETFSEEHLKGLRFLGVVGMMDPPRPEARPSIQACRQAGVEVAMMTGDHPETAFAVAHELGLALSKREVVTGPELKQAEVEGPEVLDALVGRARVFARVEPEQKLRIVEALDRLGHFVAMTGDGANDAPALRAAHVGVAMGRRGTDVARDVSDILLTDDNIASIVAGVEEGRVAYANVRKVISLLIATGAAELVLFFLALFAAVPLPLVAVQLLWLNLVTNGIQDVALAFEPAEGGEMARPPRPPKEPIFNRLMIERTVIAAGVMGTLAFGLYHWLLSQGWDQEAARNSTLLLMVLFENVFVFNCRSEMRSALRHNPLRNPLLLFGTAAAQLVHIGAMYTPGVKDVLGLEPVSLGHWAALLAIALSLLLVMEVHKAVRRRLSGRAVGKNFTAAG